MSVYENRFKKVLIEKDEPVDDTMTDDQAAMVQTLDKGSTPEDFNVQDVPPVDAHQTGHLLAHRRPPFPGAVWPQMVV
jgi:hypothetical protein